MRRVYSFICWGLAGLLVSDLVQQLRAKQRDQRSRRSERPIIIVIGDDGRQQARTRQDPDE